MKMQSISLIFLIGLITFAGCQNSGPVKIIFFGDSITELGVRSNGYVTLVDKALKKEYPDRDLTIIGAGISGNKVTDLEKRLNRDVLLKKPDIVIIYIGINDVWHWSLPGLKGTTPEEFDISLRKIIVELKSIDTKIILCTPSVIGEKRHGDNPLDSQLDQYAQISRKIATDERLDLIDLRKEFITFLADNNPDNSEKGILTYDGVHLTDKGNQLVSNLMLAELLKKL